MGHAIQTVLRSFLFYSGVALGATFLMFSFLQSAPGEVTSILCPNCDQEAKADIRKEWNLDKPFLVQYGLWLGKVVRFDFGKSISYREGEQVINLLKPTIHYTLIVVWGAGFLTLFLSLFLSWKPISLVSQSITRLIQFPFYFLSFAPLYILAYFFIRLLNQIPSWFQEAGWLSQTTIQSWISLGIFPFGQLLDDDMKWYLQAVPIGLSIFVLALGNNNLVEQLSGVRFELEHLKEKHFMKAVQAKGASYPKHLFMNMLLPLVQFFTARSVFLLGTVVIVEKVLSIPGIGYLLWAAMEKKDVPVVLSIALVATLFACFLQMCNEIALKIIDPRLRHDR